MPCVVCVQEGLGDTPAEPHHILECGRRISHEYTIPLCEKHHRSGDNNPYYVSRHPFKAEFERRYGKEFDLLDIVNRMLK